MTTTLQDIRPGQIRQHPNNPREQVGDVAELAASIAEQGIIEPLIVAPIEAKSRFGDQYVLIAGHRRLAAGKQAKLKVLPCLVREDLTDPAKQLEAALVENLQRRDLTPIEEAGAYQQLLEFPGYTVRRIATATGRSQSTVKSRIALTKLDVQTRAKIQDGQISLADAAALAEFADDLETVKKLEKAIGTYNWNWELEHAHRERKAARTRARTEATLTKQGVRIVTDGELTKLVEDLPDDATEDDEALVYAYVTPMPEGVAEEDLEDDFDVLMDPEQHRTSCEGHAAQINSATGEPRYVCLTPRVHEDLVKRVTAERDAGPVAPDISARFEAERKEREQLKADLATAAAVRGQHLASVLRMHDKYISAAHDTLRQKIMHAVDSYGGKIFARDIFADDRADDAQVIATVQDRIQSMNLIELALLLGMLDNASAEYQLRHRAEAWALPAGQKDQSWLSHHDTEQWRAQLVDVYGYQWSDFEWSLLKPAEAVDAEASDG